MQHPFSPTLYVTIWNENEHMGRHWCYKTGCASERVAICTYYSVVCKIVDVLVRHKLFSTI